MDTSREKLDERDLTVLAGLLRIRHAIDDELATMIGRPPTSGGIGEVVAAAVLDIDLAATGVMPGYDGRFISGPLAQQSVNVKAYAERGSLLDIGPHQCDWYLVLMGPPRESSHRGRSLPFRVASVYLFKTEDLVATLKAAGVDIGIATSVRKALWEEAEIYPVARSSSLVLTEDQKRLLGLFAK